jgi:peptidoglycan/LPS O-acetylase OafA/YrhL
MDSPINSTVKVSRIPELDGLRGIAILSVVLMHYFYNPNPLLTGPIHQIQRIFALGWSGVDLFFVLSGFLIGGILMDQRVRHRISRRFICGVPSGSFPSITCGSACLSFSFW